MTFETAKVLELLIHHKDENKPLTLIELANESLISEYGRVERILKTLSSEGYISALKPGNGETYMFYNLEEKAREHFEKLDKKAQIIAEQQADKKKEIRRSWIQFWLPFIVTNLISIAALIVAILAYIKQ